MGSDILVCLGATRSPNGEGQKVTGEHYRSILADPLHLMLQKVFPGERLLFQYDNTPVHTARWVKISWMSIMMKWNISRGIYSPLISTSLGLCRVF